MFYICETNIVLVDTFSDLIFMNFSHTFIKQDAILFLTWSADPCLWRNLGAIFRTCFCPFILLQRKGRH